MAANRQDKWQIVCTGASGLLGSSIMRTFNASEEFDVVGTAFSRADESKNLFKVDLTDSMTMENFIRKVKPHIVIHAAAERRPDTVENNPEVTINLNVHSVWNIARVCEELGIWLIYISTDYVFDGKTPPFHPTSYPDPINAYGKSKVRGEYAALAAHHAATILRVPVLYGNVNNLDESAVTILVKDILGTNPKKMDHFCRRYPTYTDDVARVIQLICKKIWTESCSTQQSVCSTVQSLKANGHLHWSSQEQLTKYEQCLVMASILNKDVSHLTPNRNSPSGTPRPYDCHLDVSVTENLIQEKQSDINTPFKEGIRNVLTKLQLLK